MNKGILTLFLSLFIISGCQHAGEITKQLSFLNTMVKEYGGEWNGSALGDCYELEITNSKVLHKETDSLVYYSTVIGRAFIDSLNYNFSCITFELVDKTGIGGISKSSAIEATFDLNLIRRFKDRDIEEFLTIRKAYYAFKNVYREDLETAKSWIDDLSGNEEKNPFIILANAEILRANNEIEEAKLLVEPLINDYPDDAQLNKYMSYFFTEIGENDKALNLLHNAYRLNKTDNAIIGNLAGHHQEMKNWDSVYYYTSRIIELDSNDINAYYIRAYSAFQIDETDKGCDDLAKVYQMDKTIVFADSMSTYCK